MQLLSTIVLRSYNNHYFMDYAILSKATKVANFLPSILVTLSSNGPNGTQ
jgi:hypothetical protein